MRVMNREEGRKAGPTEEGTPRLDSLLASLLSCPQQFGLIICLTSDFAPDLLQLYYEEWLSLGIEEGNLSPKLEGRWSDSSSFYVPTIEPSIAQYRKKGCKGITFIKYPFCILSYIYTFNSTTHFREVSWDSTSLHDMFPMSHTYKWWSQIWFQTYIFVIWQLRGKTRGDTL